jgi:sulfate transport system permease protein
MALAPSRGAVAVRAGVLAYLALLVALPLAALAASAVAGGPAALVERVNTPIALHALWLTLWSSAAVAVLNGVAGTATAWVLVRYRFPGRGLLSALVDLPFAIPTLVAGVMLVLLFGPGEPVGGWLAAHGMPVAFATPGILLALAFVTLPLAVRAVEPVLRELDAAEEEAAHTMGAGHLATFRYVILPALLPGISLGVLQSFARAVAEFGSIVVVSGNIPFQTLTAPVQVHAEVESGRPEAAAALSLVLLAVAIALSAASRMLRRRVRGTHV